MTTNLSGKTALITGASKGLGKLWHWRSALRANIALVSRDAQKLGSVKNEIESAGGKAGVFAADVKSEQQVDELEAEVSRGSAKSKF